MEKKGELGLITTNRGNNIEIVMGYSDGGPPQKRSGSVFNPSPIDDSKSDTYTIDLSICYSIVKHHKGEIQFDDDDIHTNRFTIRFPVGLRRSNDLTGP
jgi:K+-sensing histidine kinase KdpD